MLKKYIFTLPLAMLALTGCANKDIYSGDVYTSSQARQAQTVHYGTIAGLRNVTIQGSSSNIIGTVGGGVLGGYAGGSIGGGRGQKVATAAGAILGTALGSTIENKMNQKNALEIEIKLDNGSSVAVVQGVSNKTPLGVGQRVRVLDSGGKLTVSPM